MTTTQALAAVREAYMDGFNRGDVDAVLQVHTKDTVHMPAGMETIIGREGLRDLIVESIRHAPADFRFEFEPAEVRTGDGFAVERGFTKGTDLIPGGKYVMLYVLEPDDRWRIAWTITNSDAMPESSP